MKFKTDHLTLEQKREICMRAHDKCFNWWADILDCSTSYIRQKIDLTFEEIMEKLDSKSHFVMIYRNAGPEDYLEIGFRTGGDDPDYFLWMQLEPERIPDFTEGLDIYA